MQKVQSKISSRGQVLVPVAVRRLLQLSPGSVLEWKQDGDRIVVERAHRYTTAEVHEALFPDEPSAGAPAKTLAELKQGVRQRLRCWHLGGRRRLATAQLGKRAGHAG